MAIIFNGTNIGNIKYNGTSLDKVVYNGTVVWENTTILSLGNGQSFNVKSVYHNYASLTADDFMIRNMSNFSETGWTANMIYQDGWGEGESELYKSYNATTGILTCYVTYLYTYRDSNGTSPRYYDKKLNVNAYLILKPKADLGTATTFNVKSVYSNYAGLTVDDFYIQAVTKYSKGFVAGWIYNDRGNGVAKSEIVKSYNPSTGQLTCYLWFKWDYRDSNGTTPQSFDEHLPCHVFIAKR